MSYRTSNIICVFYDDENNRYDIGDFITEMSYSCQLKRPYQEVNIRIAHSTYSKSLPNIYIRTGTKIELYRVDTRECIFKGTVNIAELDSYDKTLKITAYDYIFNINKSKVVYNFKNMSAYDCVKTILDDLQIPYSENGIFGGKDTENAKIAINHKIQNKTAYDAIMAICTTVHRNSATENFFYIYMDVAGNVNVDTCDRYWANQVIQTATNVSHNRQVANGNVLGYTYKEDSTNLITRVRLYNSEGGKVDFNTGVEEDLNASDTSYTGSNGKVIGIDMGHNSNVPGASKLIDEVNENRNVGKKVIALLKEKGYGVVNTTDDTGTTENEELSNRIKNMNAQKLDLSISIHFNAGGGAGTEVLYNAAAGNSLAYGFCVKVSQSCGFNTRKAYESSDYVLRNNDNPAILIEVCFVDSNEDVGKYKADNVAQAIVAAVEAEVK